MEEKKKPYVAPEVVVEKVEPVHSAKSWNPGNGKDKTGTGNSDFGGGQGKGPKKPGGGGRH